MTDNLRQRAEEWFGHWNSSERQLTAALIRDLLSALVQLQKEVEGAETVSSDPVKSLGLRECLRLQGETIAMQRAALVQAEQEKARLLETHKRRDKGIICGSCGEPGCCPPSECAYHVLDVEARLAAQEATIRQVVEEMQHELDIAARNPPLGVDHVPVGRWYWTLQALTGATPETKG